MRFSIIICTHNRADQLKNCLTAIRQAHLKSNHQLQLIVVNNASRDHTATVIEEFKHQFSQENFVIMHEIENKIGKSYALMRGINLATYDYTIFLDDDNYLESNALIELEKYFTHNNNYLIGAKTYLKNSKAAPFWFPWYQHAFACGPQSNHSKLTNAVWGAGLAISTKYLVYLKEINYSFLTICRQGKKLSSGSDTELSLVFQMMGAKILAAENYVIAHDVSPERITMPTLLRLYSGFGSSDAYLVGYRSIVAHNQILTEGRHLNNKIIALIKYYIKGLAPRSSKVCKELFIAATHTIYCLQLITEIVFKKKKIVSALRYSNLTYQQISKSLDHKPIS